MTDSDWPAWPWTNPPAAFVDRRAEQLAGLLRRGPLYLLVEPTFGDPPAITINKDQVTSEQLHDPSAVTRLRNAAWESKTYLIRGEQAQLPHIMSAYLVEADDSHTRLIAAGLGWSIDEQLFAAANPGHGPYRIGGWLQLHSAQADMALPALRRDAQALARHLHELTKVEFAPGQTGTVSLYDRRVLHVLRKAGIAGWSTTMRGIRTWAYLDHNLQLQALEGEPGALSMSPLRIGADEQGMFARTAASNMAISFMLNRAFPLPDDIMTSILDKVVQAERRGLDDSKDQGAYAAEALLWPEFERWPKLDQMIQIALRDNMPLHAFIKEYRSAWKARSDNHWAAKTNKRPAP